MRRLEDRADILLALRERRRAFLDLRLKLRAEALFAGANFRLGSDALDMSPGSLRDLAGQREFVLGPLMRALLMNRHERREAAFLHERHADR